MKDNFPVRGLRGVTCYMYQVSLLRKGQFNNLIQGIIKNLINYINRGNSWGTGFLSFA